MVGSLTSGNLVLKRKLRGCARSCRSSTSPPSAPAWASGSQGGAHLGSTAEDGAGGAEKSFQLKREI